MKEIRFLFSKINNNFPTIFILGYVLLNFIVGGNSLGSNSKLGLMPFFLLIITILIYYSNEKFMPNWNKEKSETLLFFSTLINVFFYAIGEVNKESLLFDKIKNIIGVDFKWVLIIYCIIFLSLFFFIKNKKTITKIYFLPLLFFVFLPFLAPLFFPEPHIDLFKIIRSSNDLLISGRDPYERVYADIYNGEFDYAYNKQDVKLVYWPVCLYLTLPFQYIFGDFRYAYLFYLIFTLLLVYLFTNNNRNLNFISIFLLIFTNSYTFYMIKYSWIDILALPLFVLIFLFLNKKKYFISIVGLAFLVSLKLYYVFLVPIFFIYYIKKESIKLSRIAIYLLVFFLIVLICFTPFWYTNPKALLYTMQYFSNSNPRYESLSFPGLIYRTGIDLSSLFTILTLFIIGVLYYKFFKTEEVSIFTLLKYLSLVLMILFIFGKQAFGNYYYNIVILMCVYFVLLMENGSKLFYEK